jgi:pentapeptide MXKDX repeat protein
MYLSSSQVLRLWPPSCFSIRCCACAAVALVAPRCAPLHAAHRPVRPAAAAGQPARRGPPRLRAASPSHTIQSTAWLLASVSAAMQRDETRRAARATRATRRAAIKCDAMRVDAIRVDAMRVDAMRVDAMRVDAMRVDAMRVDAMRCDASAHMTPCDARRWAGTKQPDAARERTAMVTVTVTVTVTRPRRCRRARRRSEPSPRGVQSGQRAAPRCARPRRTLCDGGDLIRLPRVGDARVERVLGVWRGEERLDREQDRAHLQGASPGVRAGVARGR